MTTDYFQFFDIPISFYPDEEKLRQVFYQNSKKYHPDFFTLESEERKAETLDLAAFNNKAYNTLSDFESRMKYILDLKGVLGEEGQQKLPQEFLLDMMDINEALMELEFDFDENKFREIQKHVKQIEIELLAAIQPILKSYDDNSSPEHLSSVKDFYLKKRYILRILENLDRFATA